MDSSALIYYRPIFDQGKFTNGRCSSPEEDHPGTDSRVSSIGLNSSVFELWSKGMACPGDYIIDMDDGLFPQRKPG